MKFIDKLKENKNPLKKIQTPIADINNILTYSDKKINTKKTEEYSMLNPATNSPSASGKSKGALFVSASIPKKNNKKLGKNQKILGKKDWFIIIKYKSADWFKITTGIIVKIKKTS